MEPNADIPSPIDLTDPEQARRWVADTIRLRPYRFDFLRAFQEYLRQKTQEPIQVLELGSGPGHLAAHLLSNQPYIERYVLFDFSDAMHDMARGNLGEWTKKLQYVTADFRLPDALACLGTFDIIVTMQAVHELRHKRHAIGLYRQVIKTLKPSGHFLVCDHIARDLTAKNDGLFMTREEQHSTLEAAGFGRIGKLLDLEGMTLHSAQR